MKNMQQTDTSGAYDDFYNELREEGGELLVEFARDLIDGLRRQDLTVDHEKIRAEAWQLLLGDAQTQLRHIATSCCRSS